MYTTEEEQIQQIKKFWHEYGKPFLLIVCVMLALGYGWRVWQAKREQKAESASVLYEMMMYNHNSNTGMADQEAKQLIKNYAHTPYAKFASLLLAKEALEKGDVKTAKTQLQWVIDKSDNESMQDIAKLRLARVLLLAKQGQDALTTLKSIKSPAFAAAVEEIKGDAYVALGQREQAHQAYDKALHALPGDGNARPILQLKFTQTK